MPDSIGTARGALTSGRFVESRGDFAIRLTDAWIGLKSFRGRRVLAVPVLYGSRSEKAFVVGAGASANVKTRYAALQRLYGSDGTRTRDLRRDRPRKGEHDPPPEGPEEPD